MDFTNVICGEGAQEKRPRERPGDLEIFSIWGKT